MTLALRYVDMAAGFLNMHPEARLFPQPSFISAASEKLELNKDASELLIDDNFKTVSTIFKFAQKFVSIDRKPLDLSSRPYLRIIYDLDPKRPAACRDIVLVAGRQVEKSTTLAAKAITLCAINPFFKVLAVEPRFDQVKIFSQQRFQPMCEDSEILKNLWLSTKNVWQVQARVFNNGSVINFKSCYYSADPLRGLTSNMVIIDEAQDVIEQNIPIILESQSHIPKEERYNVFAGTPKTTGNTLCVIHRTTCQWEWLIRCPACGNENYQDEKIIGKKSYICVKCGGPINPSVGMWTAMRPDLKEKRWGFRIPQTMVPFMSHADVLKKYENPNITRKIFYNEVLGLPYDEGELILTEADIIRRCEIRPMETPEGIAKSHPDVFLCAGVDHGTGDYSPGGMTSMALRSHRYRGPSYTVMVFGGFCSDGKFRIFRIVRFTGEKSNLARQPEYIDGQARHYRARWVMSDYGFGAHTNARLRSDFRWASVSSSDHPVLLECEYVSSNTPAYFHAQAYRYMLDKNTALERTIDAIKKGEILFPRHEEMREFMEDFTTTYVDYNTSTNTMTYEHTKPDDAFQAVVYCYHAALQRAGRLLQSGTPAL